MAAGGRECSSPGRDLSETPQGFLAALTNSQDRWPHTGQLRISSLKSRRCDCIPGWAAQVRSCRAWGRDVAPASSPPVCVARPAPPTHTQKSPGCQVHRLKDASEDPPFRSAGLVVTAWPPEL